MNAFEHTKSVAFELSNWCSHAPLHEKCPLHLESIPGTMRAPVTLPVGIILDVLEELGAADYSGEVAFHQYSEPMQDPRLFWLLDRVQLICPLAQPYVVTNGANLTLDLCLELQELNVSRLVVSAHGDVMCKRMQLLEGTLGGWITWSKDLELDDRLLLYDIPQEPPPEPCCAPLRHVVINRDGAVGLCCYDWQRRHTFGDLRDHNLAEILLSKPVRRLYEELSTGRRELNPCKQCGRSR